MEIEGIKFGEITGLSFDPYGNLVVLHRASRKWDEKSIIHHFAFIYSLILKFETSI